MVLAYFVVVVVLWRLSPVRLAPPDWASERPGDVPFLNPPRRGSWRWDTAGLACVAAAFAGLQAAQPFYFTQDDVLVNELPSVLVGCRGVWDGHFPSYNPYSLMGAPLASVGIYSLTYPPTYVAYAIARGPLGNEHLTMEVFAALHLLSGYGLTRWLTARLGITAPLGVLASLTFVLSGVVLIAGRSWHVFLPVVVWLPAVTHFVVTAARRPVGLGWALGLGGCLGASFHVGFPQLSAYLGGFTLLSAGLAAASGAVPARRLAWLVPAVGFAAAVAAPLAVCQLDLGKNLTRDPILTLATPWERLLATMLLPDPLATAWHPYLHGNRDVERMGAMNFAGGPVAAAFLVGAAVLFACRTRREHWAAGVWHLCGLAALLMVLGDEGGVWPVVSELPAVGKVNRYPFRVLPFLVFYTALAGTLTLERARRHWAVPDRLTGLFAVAGVILVGFHVTRCTTAFYCYGFLPYPPLDAGPAGAIPDPHGTRVMSWARARSPAADFAAALPLQVASAYAVPSLHGYDPVVEGQPAYRAALDRLRADPRAAGAAYGVHWHLVHRTAAAPDLSASPGAQLFENWLRLEDVFTAWRPDAYPARAAGGGCVLHEAPAAAPLAFAAGRPGAALPVRLHAGGVEADAAGVPAGERVVLNFLHYPECELEMGGEALTLLNDPWGRVAAVLPRDGETLTLRYRAPWGRGLGVGAASFAAALACGLALRRVGRPADESPPS